MGHPAGEGRFAHLFRALIGPQEQSVSSLAWEQAVPAPPPRTSLSLTGVATTASGLKLQLSLAALAPGSLPGPQCEPKGRRLAQAQGTLALLTRCPGAGAQTCFLALGLLGSELSSALRCHDPPQPTAGDQTSCPLAGHHKGWGGQDTVSPSLTHWVKTCPQLVPRSQHGASGQVSSLCPRRRGKAAEAVGLGGAKDTELAVGAPWGRGF